jgi:hypothetical protein
MLRIHKNTNKEYLRAQTKLHNLERVLNSIFHIYDKIFSSEWIQWLKRADNNSNPPSETNLAGFYTVKRKFKKILKFYYADDNGNFLIKGPNDFADELDPKSWAAFSINIEEYTLFEWNRRIL